MIRKPAVAGQFYPGSCEALRRAVAEYLNFDAKPQRVIGLAAPHAGYIYSGATAGHTYASADIPKRCIVLAPSHTGMGATVATTSDGEWSMPTGNIPIDKELAAALMKNFPIIKNDAIAHVAEHSLEVQLPFLHVLRPDLMIVPINIQRLSVSDCKTLGTAIAKTIKDFGKEILIIASTDMNHYENQNITEKKDNLAIQKVLDLDPDGLINICAEENITMCGVIPTAVMLHACKALGAKEAKLVEHTTSGNVSGDFDAVVGYAGFLIY